jgi:WW domain-containing oxidoreductase
MCLFNIQFEFCFFSGFETARSLALHGCTVVFACRDLNRTWAAIGKIKEERPNATCDVIELDLARLHSVTKFAANFKLRYK